MSAAWGFTKQTTLEVTSFSQMAHYWGALTPIDNLRNSAQWRVDRWVCNFQYRVCLPFTVFWRASFLVLARVIPCFSARQSVL